MFYFFKGLVGVVWVSSSVQGLMFVLVIVMDIAVLVAVAEREKGREREEGVSDKVGKEIVLI